MYTIQVQFVQDCRSVQLGIKINGSLEQHISQQQRDRKFQYRVNTRLK